ncbi:MAG: aldo/keto reductase [Methanobacteriota archaeon]|nr:MAG: aldo/keto reductase [Euryarchaeota archaeon]
MTTAISIDTKVKLNNGIEMPLFGLGTYQATGSGTTRAVLQALETGYRLIDTAEMYGNEREVGEAVRQSGIPRDEVFITTKLWNDNHGYDLTLESFGGSLRRLGMDYVDLYLIHWPVENLRLDSWRALEKLYEEGKCRAIGVSNYMTWHLEEVLGESSTVAAVDQVEFSPYLYQREVLEFCRSKNIQLEGYSPLGKGQIVNTLELVPMSQKYSKTSAQILIRWALQHNIVTIPKSSNRDRIRENADVFDFEIAPEDMSALDVLNEDLRTSWDPSTAP